MQPLDAERVREWRHRRMLSQGELAERAGTSLFTIQRIERGEGNVRPKTGRGVAAALGVPIEELLPKAQSPLPLEIEPQRAEVTHASGTGEGALIDRLFKKELMHHGFSEEEAQEIMSLHYRPPEYWEELARAEGLDVGGQRFAEQVRERSMAAAGQVREPSELVHILGLAGERLGTFLREYSDLSSYNQESVRPELETLRRDMCEASEALDQYLGVAHEQ